MAKPLLELSAYFALNLIFGLALFPRRRSQEKSHQGSVPGGDVFNLLNTSINKKPFFGSYVVTYGNG